MKIKMAEENRKRVLDLAKMEGNNVCADCCQESPEWASYNLGVFLCTICAGIHRSLGSHISRVKSLRLDNWQDDHVASLEAGGNRKVALKYQAHVPLCYRRPIANSPQVLKEQWIRSKYERGEFLTSDSQPLYTRGFLEGWLWKRGREDAKYLLRKFVLSEADGTLKYFIKEKMVPKAVLQVSKLNAVFCPAKMNNINGLQLTFDKDGSTRNLFLYSEDGKDVVDWFMAIRSAKLHQLEVAFPGTSPAALARQLTRDFLKEGWLHKTGPKGAEAYKKRWFSLDDRRLMYLEQPLDAFPKGEIFLGHRADGYGVLLGVPPGLKEQGRGFTLKTPDRSFILGAETEEDCSQWRQALESVLERPLTPQDNSTAANMVRKRATFLSPLHILKVR